MGYKKTLASIAGFCGVARHAELLPHSARVVMCHGVTKEPIVDPIVQANQIDFELFRRNIDYIAKCGHFLTPDEFYEKFQTKSFDKRDVLLTFDDGYVNQAEVAAPYLIEKQIPFLVFVSPGLVDSLLLRLYSGDVRKARRASNSLDERRFSSPKSEGTQTDGLQTPRVHATTKRI